jgi:hypothetical protein
VLAWALLGVAVWETIGRSQGDQEPWIESELTDLPELSEPALTTA